LAPLLALAAAKISEAWDSIDASSSGSGTTSSPSSPYSGGQGSYNEEAAKAFYGERPLLVVKRLLSLAQLTGAFNLKLLFDYLRTPKGAEAWINEAERAKEALVLATKLGPTFIKLGQAASIRTDLIPQPYALELRQLQDAVPPFESQKAMEIVRRELGVESLSEVFSSLSSEPVASASIGQVYKGTLKRKRGGGRRGRRRTATTKISSTGESEQQGEEEEGEAGREVAVKVQRPSVLSEIALDLFLLRLLAPLQVRISNALNKVPTDEGDIATALALVDEWGRGFVAEVDYKLEAKNTKEFKAAMERRNLQAVTAPTVVDELSSSVVLVTEWVEGTRLDRDASSDVPRLCGVAINAYLTMLLDTGTLHCDPHPGNLLRTTDGKLCVLDWGMTLEVS
jgi:predicted unusual protein kinase regulating ubiquinone biosynthesis (AarF/ABC1/UbiB family)